MLTHLLPVHSCFFSQPRAECKSDRTCSKAPRRQSSRMAAGPEPRHRARPSRLRPKSPDGPWDRGQWSLAVPRFPHAARGLAGAARANAVRGSGGAAQGRTYADVPTPRPSVGHPRARVPGPGTPRRTRSPPPWARPRPCAAATSSLRTARGLSSRRPAAPSRPPRTGSARLLPSGGSRAKGPSGHGREEHPPPRPAVRVSDPGPAEPARPQAPGVPGAPPSRRGAPGRGGDGSVRAVGGIRAGPRAGGSGGTPGSGAEARGQAGARGGGAGR